MSRISRQSGPLIGFVVLSFFTGSSLIAEAKGETGSSKRPTPLPIDSARRGSLPSDAGKLFTFPLRKNQYVRLVAEQLDADVALILFGPSGDELYRVDRPIGKSGMEEILFMAQSEGDYQV